MAYKVCKAMADRDAQYTLAGLVEIDESLFFTSSTLNLLVRGTFLTGMCSAKPL